MPSEGPTMEHPKWREFCRRVDSGALDVLINKARDVEHQRLYKENRKMQDNLEKTTPEGLIASAEVTNAKRILGDPSATPEELAVADKKIVDYYGIEPYKNIPSMFFPEGPIEKPLREWYKQQPAHFQDFLKG